MDLYRDAAMLLTYPLCGLSSRNWGEKTRVTLSLGWSQSLALPVVAVQKSGTAAKVYEIGGP
jgi:hypothetical protein